MSGKLIMKRKRADQRRAQQADEQQQQQQQPNQGNEPVPEKRHRPGSDTPPAELEQSPALAANNSNSILLEALQKIMELQAELDSFEHDLDEREEVNAHLDADEEEHLDAEVAANFAPPASRRTEAEALGFAMCARETLLFLQSEGVSTESVLYKTLLGKLVGQSDGLLHA
ncbi:hypothetical protein KR215_002780 [Drosophila sulfurigaster]|uniref:uncharacterized protein LOC132792408 n=1 Tax=Drosophila nasuta TaxID=42062 RepID=UPI00295E3D9E|nr:uncharacterized protein LOC132792408 [Drosophila nasuta]KAH8393296.1 hypothetical protein KR215_002780 [Drosophila sulfurigaster]